MGIVYVGMYFFSFNPVMWSLYALCICASVRLCARLCVCRDVYLVFLPVNRGFEAGTALWIFRFVGDNSLLFFFNNAAAVTSVAVTAKRSDAPWDVNVANRLPNAEIFYFFFFIVSFLFYC